LKLEEYDYEIIHKAGRANANADALSCNAIPRSSNENNNNEVLIIEEEEEEQEDEASSKQSKTYTEEEKKQILSEYHDAPIGGHQGVKRTIRRIRLQHNWKDLTKDERYIARCESCQKNKLSRKNKVPLLF